MLGARRSLRVATQTDILLKYGRACSCTRFQPASRCILLLSSIPPPFLLLFPPPSFPLSSFASSLRPRLFRFPNVPLPVPLSAVTGLSADRSPSNRARQHHQSTSDDFSMAARSSPLLAFRSRAPSSISWRSPALARRDAARERATNNFFQLSSRDHGF